MTQAKQEAAALDWKPDRKFRPEEVKDAVANVPVFEQQRRSIPVLARMIVNVGSRVAEQLGEPGAEVIRASGAKLGKNMGLDLSPEKIDLTTADAGDLIEAVAGTQSIAALEPQHMERAFQAVGGLLMGVSCEILEAFKGEKPQHVVEQAWEEVAAQRMYWDTVADQFAFDEIDAKTAIGMLAGTDAFFGVQYDVGLMTPTRAERNITFCTPVAIAGRLGYSPETVRAFGEIVATSVCIRGVESMLPGLKVKYLTRIHYGDPSCVEVADYDPDGPNKGLPDPFSFRSYVLKPYHNRMFGAIASLKGQFLRPEWQRLNTIALYVGLPEGKKNEAMSRATAAIPAASEFKSPADMSEALAEADGLRWLAARTARHDGDEAKAFREMIGFWAGDFKQALASLDFPDKWKNMKSGRILKQMTAITDDMLVQDRPTRDRPQATFGNAMKLYDLVYELHIALDDQLAKLTGGAPRPATAGSQGR